MTREAFVDAVLEVSVVGSFTRIGFAARRRLAGWPSWDGVDRTGRVVVLTGGTSGLGLAAARQLVRLGATVVLVGRDVAKTEATVRRLRDETGSATVEAAVADMGDLSAVRRLAADVLARHPRVDVLVHNAGALDAVRGVTADGNEQTVATHVLGPFLLTALLRPALRAAAPSRVLWVSSGGMYTQPLDVDGLELHAAHYDGTIAYARAKRAQVVLAEQLAERLTADGVVVHAMHPGWADTPGVARSLPTFRRVVGRLLRTPEEGADTVVWLAVDDGVPLATTGKFWLDRRARAVHRSARTRLADTAAERARLWAWVVGRTGVDVLAGAR